MDTLLVYSPNINNRINYIITHILFKMLKQDFMLTTELPKFIAHEGPKINYSEARLANEFFIKSSGFLNETGVNAQDISVSEWEGLKIFYQVTGDSDLPFDIFSASFYMLSRYEEYFPHSSDQFGRFEAHDSFAYKNGFLEQAILERWVLKLKEKLVSKYNPALELPAWNYSFQSTIDIDNPFAFLHKGFVRTTGALIKTLVKFDIKTFISRLLTLRGTTKDPFETYGYIHNLEKKYDFKSIYFFLVGDYGRYDTNIPIRKLAYQNLIIDIHQNHKVGLHSSFNSNKSFKTLLDEKKRLSKVIDMPIIRSRQHFLMLQLPDTYQKLIEAGIREDYSMGYATALGFRAGTCTPFKFYDLSKEEETKLLVYPFQVMEVALHNYMRLKSTQAMQQIRRIIDEVKAVNGLFMSLWHNESLSEFGMWIGWRKVFEEMAKYASAIVTKVKIETNSDIPEQKDETKKMED